MTFNNLIDTQELHDLKELFAKLEIFEHTLYVDHYTFHYWYDILERRHDRRGEVVLAIEDTERKILLHTKVFYPRGTYRLPTGGIHLNESVLDAIKRESYEETGLPVLMKDLLGIIKIRFRHNKATLPFVSYVVYLLNENGEPKSLDPAENIIDFRSVSVGEIAQVSKNLRSLAGQWQDWGNFRAIAHDLVVKKLS